MDGVGVEDTTMEDDVEEEDDRDADGEADVDIEDANGQNGEKGARSWNEQQQPPPQQLPNPGLSDRRTGEMDRKFLDPKLDGPSAAGASSIEGIDGSHFMTS